MRRYEVTFVVKRPADPAHEGVTHLGGVGWRRSRLEIIESIHMGTAAYFARINGRRMDIGIVYAPRGLFLRTFADGAWNDGLMALPERGDANA